MEGPKWHVLILLLLLAFQCNFVINKTEPPTSGIKTRTSYGYRDGLIMEPMQPGLTVQSSIKSILPGVLSWIQQELKSRDSVTKRFILTTPPNQYPFYVAAAREELKGSLRKFYPDSEINVRARPQIDLFGFLTQIAFEVSVRRSGTRRGWHVIIKPGISMLSELRAMIPRILPRIRADLQTKSEVNYAMNVKIPFGSDLVTLEMLQSTLIALLAKYFPEHDISFTSRTEDMHGAWIDVRFILKLRRMLPINRWVINLNNGSTIEQELAKYLRSVRSQLQTSLARREPAFFTVTIQTSGEGFEDLRSQIMSVLSKYFPNERIEVALDGTGRLLDGIICKVHIYPKVSSPDYEINLDRAGVDLTMELEDLFMRILPPSSKKLEKPFSFNILLISTRFFDMQFVEQTVTKIIDMIHVLFPESNIKIDATKIEEKDWNDRVTTILFGVLLLPGENKGNNDVGETSDLKRMVIDLSQPIDSLKNQIQIWFQSLISGIKNELKNGLSLVFLFDVKPSLKNTRKRDLKKVSSFIKNILTNAFPNLQVDMKVIDQRDEAGFIEEAEIKVVIEPASSNPDIMNPTTEGIPPRTDRITTPSYLSPVPPGIEPPLGNEIRTVTLIFDSAVDLEAQVRQSLSNLNTEIWNILETESSYDLQYSIKFPQGTDLVEIEDIVGRIKHDFEQEYPNNNIDVTVGDLQRNGNFISAAVVFVDIEALKQPEIINDMSPKIHTEATKIDLSNPLISIDALLQSFLLNIISNVQKSLNMENDIIVNLNIIPPVRSGTSFLYRIADFLVPLITASLSITETKWDIDIDTTTDLYGFLVDVNLTITFHPSIKSLETRSGSNDCVECMNIDISDALSRLDKKLDKILPAIYTRILTILEQGEEQILNFSFVPPPKSNAAYLKEASNSLSMILQNYFPYNQIEIESNEDQTDEGYLLNVQLMVTIHPDKKLLPPYDIKIPIDISHGGSAANVEMALRAHMSQIQALQDVFSAVVISFQIYPPLGAKGDYLDILMSEINKAMKDLFSRKSIDTNIRAAKNSKQEYVRIEVAVTLS